MPNTAEYASPVDTGTYGEYRIDRRPDDPRPLYRFDGRISTDGSTPFPAEAGRYHLYSGWFCPWAQRTVITRSLAGLEGVIGLSYVDGRRDARGWAFREASGPDPVRGFTLLRDAYDATEPGFDGHVSVPTLFDRVTGSVVSNTFTNIGIDFATKFGDVARRVVDTYPDDLATQIDELDQWLLPTVNQGLHAASAPGEAREQLLDAFAELDRRLADRRFLLGERLTEADVRLFVSLVRFDVGPNAGRDIVPGLHAFPSLWAYARDLYAIDAFRSAIDFRTFSTPGSVLPDWDAPAERARLGEGAR